MEKFKSTMTYRNKVEDSGIEEVVKVLSDGEDEQLATIAKDLLDFWSTLEMSYRIPRVQKIESVSWLAGILDSNVLTFSLTRTTTTT